MPCKLYQVWGKFSINQYQFWPWFLEKNIMILTNYLLLSEYENSGNFGLVKSTLTIIAYATDRWVNFKRR